MASARPRVGRARAAWTWLGRVGAVAILGVLGWRVGTGPFLDGVRSIDATTLLAAVAIGAVVTSCCAWRWRLVAAAAGVWLPFGVAVAGCYRSQLLNSVLPGGVLGDVHRAVRHGLDIGDVGLGIRSVVVERIAGQSVQVAVAAVVLSVFPSPVRSAMPVVVGGALLVVAGAVLVVGRRRPVAVLSALRSLRPYGWPIVAVSTVAALGHLATFLIAARGAGAETPLPVLVPLTMLALMAMVLPMNVAGWGPREGVAAWAFAAAGLTAAQGVTTAVTYGVLVLAASAPGLLALLPRWRGPAAERAAERAAEGAAERAAGSGGERG